MTGTYGNAGATGPITIIDSSEIREGQLEPLRAAMKELVEFARMNEPRTIAYSVYLNEDATRVTVLQVHPDSASAEFHMKVAASAFAAFGELVRLSGIDIYGSPSPDLLEMLRRKAEMLGGGTVAVHGLSAGFARFEPRARPLPNARPAIPFPDRDWGAASGPG